MANIREEFEEIIRNEFREIENLLDKQYIYVKGKSDKFEAESIGIIRGRLKIAENKILNFYKKQKIL